MRSSQSLPAILPLLLTITACGTAPARPLTSPPATAAPAQSATEDVPAIKPPTGSEAPVFAGGPAAMQCDAPKQKMRFATRELGEGDVKRLPRKNNFSSKLELPAGQPVHSYRVAEGARIYVAEGSVLWRQQYSPSLEMFRRIYWPKKRSSPDRVGALYERAPFTMDWSTFKDFDPRKKKNKKYRSTGDRFFAHTTWSVKHGLDAGAIDCAKDKGGKSCSIVPEKLYVNVSSRMRLPLWLDPNPEEAEEFDAYTCALAHHERMHADTGLWVAVHGARESAKLTAQSKEELERKYKFVWYHAIRWGRREDKAIDKHTAHGPKL